MIISSTVVVAEKGLSKGSLRVMGLSTNSTTKDREYRSYLGFRV